MSKSRTILLLIATMAIAGALGSKGFGPEPLDAPAADIATNE